MWKYIAIIGVLIVLIVMLFFGFILWVNKASAEYVWKKLQKEEERSAITFNINGEPKIDLRSDKLMSLASTVKIMVAMEYAFQIEEGKLDAEELINLEQLEQYYVPNLDGGAHEAWLEYIEETELVHHKKVSIQEVARGMITFSSNANTEYLMNRLGIDHIEKRMKEIGIQDHTSLLYFTSALFIPYEIKMKEFPNEAMKEVKDSITEKMEKMSEEEWVTLSTNIHEKLTTDEQYIKDARITEWWDSDFDILFSKKFIKSTTAEYAKVMNKINNQEFPPVAQEELEYLLGMIMENEANQQWLERAGKKGGSTQYILTDAIFAEDKQGNKYEIVVFFNDLKWYEGFKLAKSLNEFELRLLSDESFRNELINKN